MRVLVCHNHYQIEGGEDQVFADECDLLRSHGHDLRTFTRHNDSVEGVSRIRVAANAIWSRESAAALAQAVKEHRSEVVHFHNVLPLISPAAYRAARKAGAAVVSTMPNYRLMCPKGMFFRDGKTCELCRGRLPLPAVRHKCYRDSTAASLAVASMLVTHKMAGTYSRHVDAYIALCDFAREKHRDAGIPFEKIELKPNFTEDKYGVGDGDGGYMMFLGRLSPEKGLNVLLDAWERHQLTAKIWICGRGPLNEEVAKVAERNPMIQFSDGPSREKVMEVLGGATALVLPSTNFEGFPKTIVESFSRGTPVIASKLGAMAELVEPGKNGLHFEPGNSDDLAACVQRTLADPSMLPNMRSTARETYLQNYTPSVNHRQLMEVYRRAFVRRNGRNPDWELPWDVEDSNAGEQPGDLTKVMPNSSS